VGCGKEPTSIPYSGPIVWRNDIGGGILGGQNTFKEYEFIGEGCGVTQYKIA
jgi:hypothetical protein